MTSLFCDIPAAVPSELTETLVQAKNVRIERIVSHGHASPAGAARLQFEDETIELKPGGWINIAAHRKCRVEWTSPNELTIWLAILYE